MKLILSLLILSLASCVTTPVDHKEPPVARGIEPTYYSSPEGNRYSFTLPDGSVRYYVRPRP
jgi:hypothetical protein